ncbi:MAG: hypothetical protein CBB68_11740, partial [Rhodospirillaceae bacterium TMED8]
TTYGSRIYADHVPTVDDPIVRRLKDAGAIILGKTNTPEFGAGANTTNEVFGATRNPCDDALTSGGSSGGSSAAVATGMAPLATGSDLGGSLRIPASFCGVVGFRASAGWVPAPNRMLGYSPLWVEGPIARTVGDAKLLFGALFGYDRSDPLSHPEFPGDQGAPSLKKIRVGVSVGLGATEVEAEVRDAFTRTCEMFQDVFKEVIPLDLDLSACHEIFRVLRGEDIVAAHGDRPSDEMVMLGDNIRANLDEAASITFDERARAGGQHSEFARAFQALFNEIDVLICPTCAIKPFPVTQNHPTEINGVELEQYYSWYALTYALSLTGSPAISLPVGNFLDGLPFGLQVVMQRDKDWELLSTAASIEGYIHQRV